MVRDLSLKGKQEGAAKSFTGCSSRSSSYKENCRACRVAWIATISSLTSSLVRHPTCSLIHNRHVLPRAKYSTKNNKSNRQRSFYSINFKWLGKPKRVSCQPRRLHRSSAIAIHIIMVSIRTIHRARLRYGPKSLNIKVLSIKMRSKS